MLYEDITSQIIKAFYKVNNTLGFGFWEKVYENAMKLELINLGMKVEQQKIFVFIMREKKLAIITPIYL